MGTSASRTGPVVPTGNKHRSRSPGLPLVRPDRRSPRFVLRFRPVTEVERLDGRPRGHLARSRNVSCLALPVPGPELGENPRMTIDPSAAAPPPIMNAADALAELVAGNKRF